MGDFAIVNLNVQEVQVCACACVCVNPTPADEAVLTFLHRASTETIHAQDILAVDNTKWHLTNLFLSFHLLRIFILNFLFHFVNYGN